MESPIIAPLIVGGQGTYRDSLFFTEYPDRELSLDYMMEVAVIAKRFKYTHIVPSGGFTQAETPDVSEASSFESVWKEFSVDLNQRIVKDEVALDSAENVICGLMAVRADETRLLLKPRRIGRIGFFSQWHFKKRRMTELAKQLGIQNSFYFHGFAPASRAAAGDAAQVGEQNQLDRMIATSDFLLLGPEWEEKRRKRFKKGRDSKGEEGPEFENEYNNRWAAPGEDDLRTLFPEVFQKLQAIKRTTIAELDRKADKDADAFATLAKVQDEKLSELWAAFRTTVIDGL